MTIGKAEVWAVPVNAPHEFKSVFPVNVWQVLSVNDGQKRVIVFLHYDDFGLHCLSHRVHLWNFGRDGGQQRAFGLRRQSNVEASISFRNFAFTVSTF